MIWRPTSHLEQPVATERADIEAPPDGGFRGASATRVASATMRLSDELTARLRAFAVRNRLALNTIAHGAWAILASRYSREDEVLLGVSVAPGHPSWSMRRARVRVSPDECALPWLRDLEAQLLAPPASGEVGSGDAAAHAEAAGGTRPFGTLALVENRGGDRDGLFFEVLADRASFDSDAAFRALGHLATLVEGIVADPERPISRLPLVTESERRQLLSEWNAPAADVGERRCLFERFEEEVERFPDGIALEFERDRLSYRELNMRANRLAWHLRRLGVGPDVLVGVCLGRSLELVVALLAVLKAGGAYVPLDPSQPPERLAFMFEDARIPILLTETRLSGSFTVPPRVRVCLIDGDGETISREEERNPNPIGSPDNLAYVIYTSGSTGRPKGVLVTHANVDRLFTATEPWFQFSRHDVWSLFHSYAFDFSVWELWGALRYGGRLVVVPRDVARSAEAFHELLAGAGVTVLNQTPSAFRHLMGESLPSAPLPRLRLVIFGGERLNPGMLANWFDRYGDEFPRLVNMYGITETTVHATFHRVTRKDLLQPAVSVIGRPIPDLQVYVLDPYLQLCPTDVIGEIHVAGAGTARGYLRRPELTRERFVPNPFSERPGERLYRSGDLGRYLPDGEIEYIGRVDYQIKVRGHRIEPGEIESVLREHPQIREAAVLERDDPQGERRLVAFLVGAEGARPPDSEIRLFLERLLPDYMVPAVFVPLDELPVTSNGKVDRHALACLDASKNVRETSLVGPRDPVEAALVAIWSQVLRVDRVGIEDDFIALGGHSLLATQILSRIQDALGVDLSLRTLFENPTITTLAAAIEAARKAGRASAPRIAALSREAQLRAPVGSERRRLR